MKKMLIALFFLATVFMSSCVSNKGYTYVLDYSKYTNEGFFISESNSASFDYKPISYIEISLPKRIASKKEKEGIEIGSINKGYVSYTAEDALKAVVKKAKELGANGVIGIEITQISSKHSSYGNGLGGFFVKGTAIKK